MTLLSCQDQKQCCIHIYNHLQIHAAEGCDHLADQKQKSSWQEHGQGVACQRPANDKIYEEPRPTVPVLRAVIHVSEIISPKITGPSVQNVHGSEHNVSAGYTEIHWTILRVKWVPLIFKITNIFGGPSPIL